MAADKETPAGDYEVGYGKPPKEHQFKKGRSGNPHGRRPQGKDKHPADILNEPVEVARDGKSQQMSPYEVSIRKAVERAVRQDDLRAIKYVIGEFTKYGVLTPRPVENGGVWVVPKQFDLQEVVELIGAGQPAPRLEQDPKNPQRTYVVYR